MTSDADIERRKNILAVLKVKKTAAEKLAEYPFVDDIPKSARSAETALKFREEIVPAMMTSEEFDAFIANIRARHSLAKYPAYQPIDKPEKRRRLPFSGLLRRARALRKLGLKGKGPVTNEKAEQFFTEMYGISYSALLKAFKKESDKPNIILCHLYKRRAAKRHVVLFPLTGAILNYYTARGVLAELQRDGLAKGIEVRTLEVPKKKFTAEAQGHVTEACQRLWKRNRFETYSVIDDMLNGVTFQLIDDAMRSISGVKCDGKDNAQGIPWLKFGEEDNSFYVDPYVVAMKDELTGKTLPRGHMIKKETSGVEREFIFLNREQMNIANLGVVKEMLFNFGRVYCRLALAEGIDKEMGRYKKNGSEIPPF